jgi:hypothetical protein
MFQHPWHHGPVTHGIRNQLGNDCLVPVTMTGMAVNVLKANAQIKGYII